MEQEKINIAALLKDCPKGTRLYSPISGECELDKMIDGIIYTNENNGNRFSYNSYGQYQNGGECLLFPSKDVRDWGCFRVKYTWGGDDAKGLLEKEGGVHAQAHNFFHQTTLFYIDAFTKEIKALGEYDDRATADYILSTGTELKIEEEQPKFKVGDVVVDKRNIIGMVTDCTSSKVFERTSKDTDLSVNVDDIVDFATSAMITKWNEDFWHPNHLHYSKSKRKIVHWFLPFDRIICRDDDTGEWSAGLFSHYDKENHPCSPYVTVARTCNECLPYNTETAKLLGTTDVYEEDALC